MQHISHTMQDTCTALTCWQGITREPASRMPGGLETSQLPLLVL